MLLVVLDQLLDLLLQLLVRDYVLSGVILPLVLVTHVRVEAHVASIVWSLVHILTIAAVLCHRLSVIAATCNTVVLVSSILPRVLLVDLGLKAVIDVVVRRLLDHATTVRVPIRGRPLNEVLRERCLLLILHLGRIVVRNLDWLVL